jgi:hypothetical protein
MTDSRQTPATAPVDIAYDENFITIYRALDRTLCQAIIDRFDQDGSKRRGMIGRLAESFSTESDTKHSWDLEIPDGGAWQDIFRHIHPKIEACITHYVSRSPVLQSFELQLTGYKIQMYPQNEGYFRWHADSVGQNARDRVAALVLYLNDVDKGGDTEFFHQGVRVAPKAGYLAMFPTGWDFMHCGHVPESGHKYIIQAFVKLKT